jgi:hypothetical protein
MGVVVRSVRQPFQDICATSISIKHPLSCDDRLINILAGSHFNMTIPRCDYQQMGWRHNPLFVLLMDCSVRIADIGHETEATSRSMVLGRERAVLGGG